MRRASHGLPDGPTPPETPPAPASAASPPQPSSGGSPAAIGGDALSLQLFKHDNIQNTIFLYIRKCQSFTLFLWASHSLLGDGDNEAKLAAARKRLAESRAQKLKAQQVLSNDGKIIDQLL